MSRLSIVGHARTMQLALSWQKKVDLRAARWIAKRRLSKMKSFLDFIGGILLFVLLCAFCWLCCTVSGYHWEWVMKYVFAAACTIGTMYISFPLAIVVGFIAFTYARDSYWREERLRCIFFVFLAHSLACHFSIRFARLLAWLRWLFAFGSQQINRIGLGFFAFLDYAYE